MPGAVIVLLEVLGRVSHLDSYSLALPSQVLVALWGAVSDGSIWSSTAQTLTAAFVGASVGCCIGLALGVALGLSPTLNKITSFTIELLRPIPSVALIPIIVLVSGLGFATEISIVAFGTVWPTLVLSRAAIAGIDARLIEVSDALRLSLAARIWKIILPSILPHLFVAFRLAIGFALVIAITVEITTNPIGLGYAMVLAQNALNPSLMLANLMWIGTLGALLNTLLAWTQMALFGRWTDLEHVQ